MKHNTSHVTHAMREAFKIPVTVDYIPDRRTQIDYNSIKLVLSGSVSPNE
jgi:hypothetical protein